MKDIWRLAVLLLVLALPSETWGQDRALLPDASRVRVTANQFGVRGAVGTGEMMAANILFVALSGETLLIPMTALQRLEISEGRRAWNGQGSLMGAAIGLAFGFGAGALGECTGIFSRGDCLAIGTIIIGIPSAVIGVVIGGLTGRERWRVLSVPGDSAPPR